MAIYDPTNPPLFITGTVTTATPEEYYPYDDDTGLFGSGVVMTYRITVSNILAQNIGVENTRSGGGKQYTAIDIKTGDWMVNKGGQTCLRIEQIIEKTEGSITFLGKDVDMISYKTYSVNAFGNGDGVAFFELSDNGQALITTENISFFTSPANSNKVEGRFTAVEETERYRLEFEAPQSGVDVGDIITVDTVTGEIVQQSAANAASTPIGILLEKSMGDTVLYIKPFNTILDQHPAPERLTGSAGQTYWSDPAQPGLITTTQQAGATALFLQIRDAIPTIVSVTAADYLPTQSQSLVINNTIIKAVGDAAPADLQALVDQINADTATHKVIADINVEFASITSKELENPATGDPLTVASGDNGSTWYSVDFTISDGTNSATISFTDPALMPVPVTLIPYPSATDFLTYDSVAAAAVLNYYFALNNIDLTATSIDTGTDYGNLKIAATSATAQILITDLTQDPVSGAGFAGGFGLPTSTPAAAIQYMNLTRNDGGDILIQGIGGYVNINGLTSSSSGSPALLLMLEGVGEGAGETVEGIGTEVDLDQTPNVTSGDGSATGVFITYTPWQDSLVSVRVNGIDVNLGNGSKTKACYFSHDGGTNARLIKDIQAGDQLYWNASVAGYELDGSDDVDVVYEAASDDL